MRNAAIMLVLPASVGAIRRKRELRRVAAQRLAPENLNARSVAGASLVASGHTTCALLGALDP